MGYIPLRGLGKIVVADLGKVALLPEASVDERNIRFSEFLADVVCGKVGDDGFGMLARVSNDVGHGSFLPVLVDLRVAFLASRGTDIVRGLQGRGLLRLFLRRQRADAANKENQLPRVGVVLLDVRISRSGHAGETDSVLDDVVDFAVGEILRRGQAEIGRFGIKILPDIRLSVSVCAVAVCATIRETLFSFCQNGGIRGQGILFVPRMARD